MVLNIIVVVLMLVITMLWGIRGKGRGLFSALLTFVCVLIAGAVAFGLWEPITYGLLLGWRPDLAWGLGLVLPYALTLGVLRLIVETLVPKNVKVDDLSNFVGGAIFGFGSAVITTGIVVIGLGSVNFGPNFLGYSPIKQDGGNLVYDSGLWVPADAWTTALYEHLSIYSFGAGNDAMALRHPDLHVSAAMNRLVYSREGDKKQIARNDLQRGDASIVGAYGSEDGVDFKEFTQSDTIDAPQLNPQNVDGKLFPAGSSMVGYVVQFEPGAREAGGQVVVGPGQVRLVYRLGSKTAEAVHPHAIVSDPEANSAGKVWFPRNIKEMFVPSVGGESITVMGFEFIIPPNAVPVDLLVKGTRIPIEGDADLEVQTFADYQDRDGAIRGALYAGGSTTIGELDRSDAVQSNEGVATNNRMGRRVINITTGIPGSIKVNDDNEIIDGKAEVTNSSLSQRGLDANNRIDSFAKTRDTSVVQITLAETGNITPMGEVVQRIAIDGRPRIFDSEGRAYDAIGYIYSNNNRTWIKFEPGRPLNLMSEIEDQLSSSKRDQTLILIFRPTRNITLEGFAIDDKLIGEFSHVVN